MPLGELLCHHAQSVTQQRAQRLSGVGGVENQRQFAARPGVEGGLGLGAVQPQQGGALFGVAQGGRQGQQDRFGGQRVDRPRGHSRAHHDGDVLPTDDPPPP